MRPISKQLKGSVTTLTSNEFSFKLRQEKLVSVGNVSVKTSLAVNDQVEVGKFHGRTIGFTSREQVNEKLSVGAGRLANS